ncbi:MAG: division/cell wall cluster transcriptional repressor MraZ [Candidatus Omnitrophica bacterium]|nr:division/cell wall cluster transcriptional repressor MraZ [Candidatus Omnitrophota bacterium]
MLYGEYEHTVDRKGRVIIPSKFRQALTQHDVKTLFLTRGLDGCLFLFPEAEWRLAENRFKQIPFTKAEGRKFNRLFFSGAAEVAVDGLGRILIPKALKEFAQIKTDVVIVGVSSRMEIWAKEKWQAFYDSSRQSFEEVAERVMLD